jgi:hypothetical protein
MSDILGGLENARQALEELKETMGFLDARVLAKKTEIEKKDRAVQKELAGKAEALEELKQTSGAILANIDGIIAKLNKVLE